MSDCQLCDVRPETKFCGACGHVHHPGRICGLRYELPASNIVETSEDAPAALAVCQDCSDSDRCAAAGACRWRELDIAEDAAALEADVDREPEPCSWCRSRYGHSPTCMRDRVDAAQAAYDALTPAEKAAADQRQRDSWVRGEIGMGSDKDEAAYSAALSDSDRHVFDADKDPEPTPYLREMMARYGSKLPTDAATRKNAPICRGVLDYFPLALAAVAECSRVATEQHHPGQPMHWERGKSTDHEDCIVRHLIERGTIDTDGVRHATKVAWRALALLQTELEEAGK